MFTRSISKDVTMNHDFDDRIVVGTRAVTLLKSIKFKTKLQQKRLFASLIVSPWCRPITGAKTIRRYVYGSCIRIARAVADADALCSTRDQAPLFATQK